jgi:hypothetical protein
MATTGQIIHERNQPATRETQCVTLSGIDLADPGQSRIPTGRLVIYAHDLQRVIAKVGNSITAVCKKTNLKKRFR